MADFNEEQDQPATPQILIDPAQMAGSWANFARVSHSPYEFTLDFIRLDFSNTPPQGIVVARVSLSPLMVTQLITALQDNWQLYADKSMPPEVREHGAGSSGDAPGGRPEDTSA